jgi:hypothetical protein
MPRKSAAQPKEVATLPEILIPPSQAAAKDREAYWLSLLAEPDNLKSAVQTEEFWPMLQDFPSALWTSNRLSLYLYRRPSDEGLTIKNAEGKKGYIKIFHQPLDEEFISRQYGGGKYTLYLKLDHKLTLTEFTFTIDGTPKVIEGQVVEIAGEKVALRGGTAQPTAEQSGDAVAKVIDATNKVNESAMGILAEASKTAIEMVKSQAEHAAVPARNPLDDVKTLLEIVRPQPVVQDPVQQELMKQLIARALAPPAVVEAEEKETPVEQTLSAIKELSGGLSLAELMKPAARAAAVDSMAGWAPIVSTIGGVASQFLERWPAMMAARNEQLRLEIHLRTIQLAQQKGEPIPTLPALPPAPSPQAPSVQSATPPVNQPLDPARLMNALVMHICAGFDKAPVGEWGEATAAAMDFHFSGAIESIEGLTGTLANAEEVDKLVAGVPELEKRSRDARWKIFREDFLEYCQDRWGVPAKPGPQPVA